MALAMAFAMTLAMAMAFAFVIALSVSFLTCKYNDTIKTNIFSPEISSHGT